MQRSTVCSREKHAGELPIAGASAASCLMLNGLLIGLGVFALLLAVWWPMRGYVRIRRKNCCGKGCGCLFPAKAPVKPPARS